MRRVLALSLTAALVIAAAATGAASAASAVSVTATSGAFVTVVPTGFRNRTSSTSGGAINIQYFVTGPAVNGFTTNINIVPDRVQSTNIDAVTQAELAGIRRVFPKAHGFSKLASLQVGGTPARAVSYLNPLSSSRVLHQRQVYVIHGGSTYVITYTALAGPAYAASLPALGQVIAGWHWR